MTGSDLHVESFSEALKNYDLDVVVSGSIGAIESIRFVRSLRRIGANPFVFLTRGGKQFVSEMALSWASAHPVQEEFSGLASHIALRSACIIAPASANFIGKIAHGVTDTPASALIASYLGQKKPVILIPNMHNSLFQSPFVQENLNRLRPHCIILEGRQEEDKQKFPDPKLLADRVAHILNQSHKKPNTLISMGTTRGYIDDVRYVSNYSSGALGTLISEELYRQGFPTTVIAGPAPILPHIYTQLQKVETNEQLADACIKALEKDAEVAVLAASVLDFIPTKKRIGKISSSENLEVSFKKTEKIIGQLYPRSGIKVGFKLEANLDEAKALNISRDYFNRYALSLMVLNALKDVDEHRHQAFIVTLQHGDFKISQHFGKQSIALAIANHIKERYDPDTLAQSSRG